MYFSVIEPAEGREREAAFARLDGPYAEHQWLWQFFQAPAGSPRDFLFRSMNASMGNRFYVVSARPPNDNNSVWSVRSKPYSPQCVKGQRLCFDLRVNPVVTTTRNNKKSRDDVIIKRKKELLLARGIGKWSEWRSEDRPLENELVADACQEWLCSSIDGGQSRAERAGFIVVNATLRAEAYLQHRSHKKGIRFSTVDLSGELEVIDPQIFLTTLQKGIGHGKAFGCGLLMVRRA